MAIFNSFKGRDLLAQGSGTPMCTIQGHKGCGYPKANCPDCNPITEEEKTDEEWERTPLDSTDSSIGRGFGQNRLS